MPKVKLEVNKDTLQQAINEVETNETFPNLSRLYEAVAPKYNELKHDDLPEIKASVAGLRIKEFSLTHKTTKGKKGGGGGSGPRTSKKEKFANDPKIQHSLEEIEFHFKEDNVDSHIAKVKNGSRTAAVTLKCIDCSGGQKPEVRKCAAYSCPLWPFRPYQE